MSKQIKLSEDTYRQLEELMLARETFDNVVRRLLDVYAKVQGIKTIPGTSHYQKEVTK